ELTWPCCRWSSNSVYREGSAWAALSWRAFPDYQRRARCFLGIRAHEFRANCPQHPHAVSERAQVAGPVEPRLLITANLGDLQVRCCDSHVDQCLDLE